MLQLPPTDAIAAGPFAALSLIVAPAILTNACSLLVMSTSNRLARAVDLAREVAARLEATTAGRPDHETRAQLREMSSAHLRSLLLLRALRAVYTALGGFAFATLVSLLGVVFTTELPVPGQRTVQVLAIAAGAVGVGGVLWAAALLVRETRIAVGMLRERVTAQQARFAELAE